MERLNADTELFLKVESLIKKDKELLANATEHKNKIMRLIKIIPNEKIEEVLRIVAELSNETFNSGIKTGVNCIKLYDEEIIKIFQNKININ